MRHPAIYLGYLRLRYITLCYTPPHAIAAWIAIFGIVVSAAVTLGVAYMQRKQMRQVELHRADPTVPLVPPPHPPTRFLKSNGIYLLYFAFCGYDLWVLVRDLSQTAPVTRTTVLYTALDTTALILTALLGATTAIMRRSLDVGGRIIGVQEVMTESMDGMTKAMDKMMNIIDDIDARVAKLEEKRDAPPQAGGRPSFR